MIIRWSPCSSRSFLYPVSCILYPVLLAVLLLYTSAFGTSVYPRALPKGQRPDDSRLGPVVVGFGGQASFLQL